MNASTAPAASPNCRSGELAKSGDRSAPNSSVDATARASSSSARGGAGTGSSRSSSGASGVRCVPRRVCDVTVRASLASSAAAMTGVWSISSSSNLRCGDRRCGERADAARPRTTGRGPEQESRAGGVEHGRCGEHLSRARGELGASAGDRLEERLYLVDDRQEPVGERGRLLDRRRRAGEARAVGLGVVELSDV